MSYTSYKVMFRDDNKLSCWVCGAEVDKASLIEWRKDFEKEIICDSCLGEMIRNEKNFKILAEVYK